MVIRRYQRCESNMKDESVTIIVDGVRLLADRERLSAASNYFSSMFSGMFYESKSKEVVIFGPHGFEISPAIMKLILHFVDTRSITLDCESALQVLSATNYLDMMDLCSVCVKFLEQNLTHINWAGIYTAALHLNMHDFVQSCYIKLRDFGDAVDTTQLSYEDIKTVLEDQFKILDPIIIYRAVVSWLKTDEQRMLHSSDLLGFVDFKFMDDDFIKKQVLNEEVISNSPFVKTGIEYILANRKIIIVGGQKASSSFIEYCPRSKELKPRSKLVYPCDRSAVGRIRNKIIVSGGMGCTSEVQTYDLDNGTWEVSPSTLETARFFATGAVTRGKLYVVGGFDLVEPMTSIEAIDADGIVSEPQDPHTGHSLVLQQARSHHTVINYQDDLYVFGGENCGTILNSCEHIDISTLTVSPMTPMLSKRAAAAAVLFRDEVIVLGGFDGEDILRTAEKYSFECDSWTSFPPMTTPRKGHCACVFDGKIFVFGGVDTNTIEVFDPEVGTWKIYDTLKSPMRWCSALKI